MILTKDVQICFFFLWAPLEDVVEFLAALKFLVRVSDRTRSGESFESQVSNHSLEEEKIRGFFFLLTEFKIF